MKRFAPTSLALMALSGAAHAEGMPQLDFGNKLMAAQIIWGAIIFTVFYVLVSRWGLPKVGSILEMRAQAIATDLDKARAAKEQADKAVAELNAARHAAYVQSAAAIAAAAQQAKAESEALAATHAKELETQLAQSEVQIHQARTQAMGALREVATEAAHAIAAKVAFGHANQDLIATAVGEILAERGLAA